MKRTFFASVLAVAVIAGINSSAQAGSCGFCFGMSWKAWRPCSPCGTPDCGSPTGCASGVCHTGAPAAAANTAMAYGQPAFVPAYGQGGMPMMAYGYNNYPAYGAAPAFAGVNQAHYQAALAQAMQAMYGNPNVGGYDHAAVAFGGR